MQYETMCAWFYSFILCDARKTQPGILALNTNVENQLLFILKNEIQNLLSLSLLTISQDVINLQT